MIQDLNQRGQNALAKAKGDEERKQIQDIISSEYQRITQQISPVQAKVNAINQFDTKYSTTPSVSIMDTTPSEADSADQVIDSPMTVEIP